MRSLLVVLTLMFLTTTLTSGIAAQSQPATPSVVYLPLVHAGAATPLFGFESNLGWLSNPTVRARAQELGATWVRINGVRWHVVQPEQNGGYNWAAIADFDRDLEAALAVGLIPTVVIRGSPSWAASDPNSLCSIVREEHLADYAAFLTALAARYRDRVIYWEMGNEPDVDPREINSESPFGCQGNLDDPYFGGERYGRMLHVASAALRRGNPSAQVVFGGLLLDAVKSTEPTPGHRHWFLEGALRAGIDNAVDVIAIHSHPGYANPAKDHDLQTGWMWDDLGGWIIGKTRFTRETTARYGLNKPIWINETTMPFGLAGGACAVPTADLFTTQASHIVRIMARAASHNVGMMAWYTLNGSGWCNSGLLDAQQQPRPAFIAYKHMIATTAPYRRVYAVNYGPDIEAYRFDQGPTVVDVLWRRSVGTSQVRGPQGTFTRATTLDGRTLTTQFTASEWVVDVGFAPIFIERRP
ncbi:MAG: hypothetical protein EI684_23400 [Candidatus Viridilinea halotolerans]|uniref:Glycoside hydrolase family 5 domain-containing protein n=1 Tax=Candidatus Viridilinea halotolerans TaxID=2491704 RepID=A0A426TQ69_9CHLR|nr:MAG: hypothetical protein EI684_23400 [Candidatus Viridilinea halotolerans]